MALIKLGGLAQDVRGSLNGTVFSRNRGGAYVRTKVSPCQPVSDYSAAARSMFSYLAKYWGATLDQPLRDAWIQYAADHPYTNVFGDSITLSGIAMFQAINRALLQIGTAVVEDPTTIVPPAAIAAGPTPIVTETTNAIDEITALVTGTLGENDILYIMASPPIPPSRTPQAREMRLVNIASGTQPVIATDLVTLYNARFGTPNAPEDYVIVFSIRAIDDTLGGQGTPLVITVPIAAAA